MLKRLLKILAILAIAFVALALITNHNYKSEDWSSFDVLAQKAPRPKLPVFNGKPLPYDEYIKWVNYGEDWFRSETFGNERLWTDVVGLLNGTIDVPDGRGG